MTKQKEKREQHYKIDSLTFTYYYSFAETKPALIYTRAERPWSEPYFERVSALPNKAFSLWKLFFKKWRFELQNDTVILKKGNQPLLPILDGAVGFEFLPAMIEGQRSVLGTPED